MKRGARSLLPELEIVNIVATTELMCQISLERLVSVKGFLCDTASYPCAYLKDDNTRAKIIIFATGKMISVGTTRLEDAKHDLRYATRRLKKLGLVSKTTITVKLRNIVATGSVGHPIDIEGLSTRLPNIIYEPEQFPGAIYYASELEGASTLIFANGKVVFAGLKTKHLLEIGRRVIVDFARLTTNPVD